MSNAYYKACPEFDRCNELIEKYWNTKQFEKCFEGHMELAEKGYPLAECQVGYFFYDGIGVEKDAERYWTASLRITGKTELSLLHLHQM